MALPAMRKATIAGLFFSVLAPTCSFAQLITTYAGGGASSADNIAATSARVIPYNLTFDRSGNLLIVDLNGRRLRRVNFATGNITTIAGNGTQGTGGDGGPATSAAFMQPYGVAVDGNNNSYVSDWFGYSVRRVDATTGTINRVAGNGTQGFSGDGGLAISAMVDRPSGMVFDNAGRLIFVDRNNFRIRRVAGGIITTIAGSGFLGTGGFGDGGPATSARFSLLEGLGIDSANNLYIVDAGDNRIRKVDAQTGIITTLAGGGSGVQGNGGTGDGGSAINAFLDTPRSVVVDGAGNVFIGELSQVRRVDADTGIITTVVGHPGAGFYNGDNIPATSANLSVVYGLALDGAGNLYLSELNNERVRRVAGLGVPATTAPGIISTVAGNGSAAYSGDGGPATSASINFPDAVAIDRNGNLLIADASNNLIRKVNLSTGIITTFAGTGSNVFNGDGIAATAASLALPPGVAVDAANNVIIADRDHNRIRRVDASTGNITTIAGNGVSSYGGDGGPATSAMLLEPMRVAVDAAGNIYIGDTNNQRVRRVDKASGTITTIAGNGTAAFSGDNGPATAASLNNPESMAFDAAGNLYIADFTNDRVRRVSAATGVITTVAGGGSSSNLGDGGAATAAFVGRPVDVALDGAGNLFIATVFPQSRVRRVDAQTGIITTIAGTGSPGYSGDNGPATAAGINSPQGLAFDSAGNLYIAEFNQRVRRVANAGVPLPAASAPLTDSVNADAAPSFLIWANPAVTDVGWFYTPASSYSLTGIRTKFLPVQPSDTGDRVVTIEFLTAPRADGGTLLGSATFNSSTARGVLGGADFAAPITLVAGQRYFVGFRNVAGLGMNVTGACGPANNGCSSGPGHNDPNYNAAVSLPPGLRLDNNGVNSGQYSGLNPDTSCAGLDCPILQFVGQNPTPAISSLSPATVAAGAASFNLQVIGSRFVSGSAVTWNGTPRATTFVNDTRLTAVVTAADVAAIGAVSVGVTSPAPGGGASNTLTFSILRKLTDTPSTAPPVVDSRVPLTADSTNAPDATVQPTCGTQSKANPVWVKYTAPASGTVTVDTAGTAYVPLLSIWTGTPASLTQVACAQGSTAAARAASGADVRAIVPAKLQVAVTPNIDVWALVTAANGTGGPTQVGITFLANLPVPLASMTTIMPHIVTGGGYVTKLTLVNMSGGENNVSVNFNTDQGAVSKSVTRRLQPGETLRLATDEAERSGQIATQWASISSQARTAANLFFEISDQSPQNNIINTVGFNDDAGATTFNLPVEFEPTPPGAAIGRTVGLALSNTNNATVDVGLTLADSAGNTVGTASVPLNPFTHTQKALNFDFQSVLPPGNFVGTVIGSVSPGLPVSVVAVGDDFGPFFATPPLGSSARAILPHIANGLISGLGYVTKLTLVNRALTSNSVTITYFDSAGLQTGTATYMLAPRAVQRINGDEAQRFGSFVERWAIVTATGAVAANAFFEIEDQTPQHNVVNTVGFNNAPELVDFTIPVELEPASAASPVGRTVGVVFANANGSPATVTLQLLASDGTVAATRTRTLPAMSQLLMSVQAEFSTSLPNSNFIGALVVHSSAPIAAVAVEDDYGPFSAIPVIPGRP
jgi:sugar lactone lactonase YvrE